MSEPFAKFHWTSFNFSIVTKYHISNVLKGVYTPSHCFARIGKDSLTECSCSPNFYVVPNMTVCVAAVKKTNIITQDRVPSRI
jgi:hypothetical protein